MVIQNEFDFFIGNKRYIFLGNITSTYNNQEDMRYVKVEYSIDGVQRTTVLEVPGMFQNQYDVIYHNLERKLGEDILKYDTNSDNQ